MLLSVAIQGWPALSLASLLVGRLVLGAAESLVGSAAIGWGIGRVGAPHTAKVISWNGIASYGAIALGAPLVLLVQWLGLWSMGASIVLLGALGFALAWPKLPAPLVHGERLPFHHVLGRVTPHGMGLALGRSASAPSPPSSPLLRQPWLGQRSALPECLRRLLHRRPAVVRQ